MQPDHGFRPRARPADALDLDRVTPLDLGDHLVSCHRKPARIQRQNTRGRCDAQHEVGNDYVFALKTAENRQIGAELADGGGDDLTGGVGEVHESWLPRKGNDDGAGDGIRTRDIDLGKVALYQLSYSRA